MSQGGGPPPPPRSKRKVKPAPRPPPERAALSEYDEDESQLRSPYYDGGGDGASGYGGDELLGGGNDDYVGGRPSPSYSSMSGMPQQGGANAQFPDEAAPPKNILADEPETTIGKNVKMNGRLEFKRLLRIDGTFEGKLISSGDLIIGPTGTLIGDIEGMDQVIVDGKVNGAVQCNKVDLRDKAAVHGAITTKSIRVDPNVVIVGALNVNPFAPERVDTDGKIIVAEEAVEESMAGIAAPAAAPPAASKAPTPTPPAAEPAAEPEPAAAPEPEPEPEAEPAPEPEPEPEPEAAAEPAAEPEPEADPAPAEE